MPNYFVTTESGATYYVNLDESYYVHANDPQVHFDLFQCANIEPPYVPWFAPSDWEDVDEPQIGFRMHFSHSGTAYYRISTPVVSVQTLGE